MNREEPQFCYFCDAPVHPGSAYPVDVYGHRREPLRCDSDDCPSRRGVPKPEEPVSPWSHS